MAENNEKTQEKQKKDSPLMWLLILIINIGLIFFMWNYYQKLKSQTIEQTIGTATVTMTTTVTLQEKAIVGYNLAEVLYNDLKLAHEQMMDTDFITAQETLTRAVSVNGITLKIISVESGDEKLDQKLSTLRQILIETGYHLNQTLEFLYKELNDEAMAYFSKNIDLEKLKNTINDGKQYYINVLIESRTEKEE